MPLLQSVFCLQGYDDRSRFLAIASSSLLIFIIFSTVFSSMVVNLLLLLVLTLIVTLTTIRRLRDAKLSKSWQLIPSILFLIAGITTLFSEDNVGYYLLLLPSLFSALLLTYPSKKADEERDYIYGYYGPIDLTSYQQSAQSTIVHSQRIEPTLVSDGANTHFVERDSITATEMEQESNNQKSNQVPCSEQADIGERIRLSLFNNKKLQLGLIVALVIILITTVVTSLFTQSTDNTHSEEDKQQLAQEQTVQQGINNSSKLIASKRQYLAMPDNFDLYLTPYQGILLHWQADNVANNELWSQLTAQGDESCQVIRFNKGNNFRPLTVDVENNSEYFASFSPLDTQALIKAIAFQSNFSLCGYNFSLKGSQAVLGKHNSYASFLEK
jgi:Ca2+/Na+ antiporter